MNERKLLIGTSGYQYKHWKGVFYPQKLPQKEWFAYYAQRFSAVEINATFYNLPKAETIEKWRDTAPEGFNFVLKFSRYGSHMKRLKDPGESIRKFWDTARHLQDKLAAVLVQLPPKWKPVPERLDAFLAEAPDGVRWVLEFRDERWLTDEIYDVLRRHKAALCIHDLLPDHPRVATSDLVYLRFHGDNYAGSYTEKELEGIAAQVLEHLARDRDVMCFFNNDAEGNAVLNAARLKEIIAES